MGIGFCCGAGAVDELTPVVAGLDTGTDVAVPAGFDTGAPGDGADVVGFETWAAGADTVDAGLDTGATAVDNAAALTGDAMIITVLFSFILNP